MTGPAYTSESTGPLLVDPYNDFLSEGGKLNGLAKPVADKVGTLANLRAVTSAARSRRIQVFYVPHHRARPDEHLGWQHASPYQLAARRSLPKAPGAGTDILISAPWPAT